MLCQRLPNDAINLGLLDSTDINYIVVSDSDVSSGESETITLLYNGQDTGIEISNLVQNCRYDKNGILVYSDFVSQYYESEIEIPRNQYVLYIHTSYTEEQIFPVKDFIIDEDSDTLYMLRETSGSEVIEKMILTDKNLKTETISELSFKDIIISKYQLPGTGDNLYDLQSRFADFEVGENGFILKVEAKGIYTVTGEKYYIDWEWNEATREEKTISYTLKKWDAQKDKETFKKCSEIFDRIEQGDWSLVTPIEGMEYLWEMNSIDGDWIRVDVNNDGMPELISQCGNGHRTENKRPIDLIFSWNNDHVELAYIDLDDADQFYYYSGNGSLIYETGALANYASYSQCILDEKWKCKTFYTLGFDRTVSETTYETTMNFYSIRPKTEEELRDNPDNEYWVEKEITKEQFLKYYKEMTGVDFLVDNESWEWEFTYE